MTLKTPSLYATDTWGGWMGNLCKSIYAMSKGCTEKDEMRCPCPVRPGLLYTRSFAISCRNRLISAIVELLFLFRFFISQAFLIDSSRALFLSTSAKYFSLDSFTCNFESVSMRWSAFALNDLFDVVFLLCCFRLCEKFSHVSQLLKSC